jgi:hypothetical protein
MKDFLANLAFRNLHPDEMLQPRMLSRFETAQPVSFVPEPEPAPSLKMGGPGEEGAPGSFREPDLEEVMSRVSSIASAPQSIASYAAGERKEELRVEPVARQAASVSESLEATDGPPSPRSRVEPIAAESKNERRMPFEALGEVREGSRRMPFEEGVARRVPFDSAPTSPAMAVGRGFAGDELDLLADRIARIEFYEKRGEAVDLADQSILKGDRRWPPRSEVEPAAPSGAELPVSKEPLMTRPAQTVIPRFSPVPAADLAAKKEEPVPVIQVTIGRVEVRAAMQPQQPTRSAPKAPATSLEEYLKRPGGGGR